MTTEASIARIGSSLTHAWLAAILLLVGCGAATGRGPAAGRGPARPQSQNGHGLEHASERVSHPQIRLTCPTPGSVVSSPLTVRGVARGPWYFEADFPIRVLDAHGRVLGEGYAQAVGEWMTEDFVGFRGEVRFAAPRTETGTLALLKANPSGLPEHADALRLPIRFATPEGDAALRRTCP